MALATNQIDINRSTSGLTLTPEQSGEIISKAVEMSAIMQLGERVSLPGRGLSIPVVLGEPTADFVNETAEKPVSEHTLSTKTMTPYKIAVIELFSNEFKRDYARLYDELVRRLPASVARKFDTTVFNGATPGTGFDTLADAEKQDIETDAYKGLVAAYGKVAAANYRPDAFALSPAAEVVLYGATDTTGRPLFMPSLADGSVGAILGAPVIKSANVFAEGNPATIGVVGDFAQLKWGIVDDIDLAISEEATINTGTEQVNLWQRNMFAVRCEMEVGAVISSTDAFVKLTGTAGA